jgi:hypothetical protein
LAIDANKREECLGRVNAICNNFENSIFKSNMDESIRSVNRTAAHKNLDEIWLNKSP